MGAEAQTPIDSRLYRSYVGPEDKYDLVGANQFNLLTRLGLRENHFLLDIGCGSLRAGRLFIPYLLTDHYFGIEPQQWLIDEGIRNNLGKDIINVKHPHFDNNSNFNLSVFNRQFDFILAQSIFSHASPSQIRKCILEAKKIMTPYSIFAATFLKGDRDNENEGWLYPGCYNYTIDFINSLTNEANLICKQLDWVHPNGQTWVVITSIDNLNNIPNI